MLDSRNYLQEVVTEEKELQEFFDEVIPKLLEYIEGKNITHILLLEKTARLFKAPLIHLFSKLWIDVKVGSYAPDYFMVWEWFFYKKKQAKKLNFLPSRNDRVSSILILDDFSASWRTLNIAYRWLCKLWFPSTQIYTRSFSWKSDTFMDMEEWTILNKLLQQKGWIYERESIFKWDKALLWMRHAQINREHLVPYKQIIRNLTHMILSSVQ